MKGSAKVTRYAGQVAGDPTYPAVQVRDPRFKNAWMWGRLDVFLPVPRFRVYLSSFQVLCIE